MLAGGVILPILLFSTSSLAEAFCADLKRFVASADAPGPVAASLPGATSCDTALQQGGRTAYCFWRYDLRAPEAETDFNALTQEVEACLAPTTVSDDQDVNHPDTYSARLYRIDGVEISVSLKDKAALGQTLIFLRAGAQVGAE